MTMSRNTGHSRSLRASITPPAMTQFEIFANPVSRSRPAYPLVVILQADVARGGHERAVAPVAPRAAFPHPISGHPRGLTAANRRFRLSRRHEARVSVGSIE